MAKLLIRSLLIPSMSLVGRLENESTDHNQGIAPVPLWVRPEPRRPGWDYRSPTIADGLQLLLSMKYSTSSRELTQPHLSRVFLPVPVSHCR